MSTTNTEDSMRWGPPHDALREQVLAAVRSALGGPPQGSRHTLVADAVLAVFAERERVLRERVTVLLSGMEFSAEEMADVLAVFGGVRSGGV